MINDKLEKSIQGKFAAAYAKEKGISGGSAAAIDPTMIAIFIELALGVFSYCRNRNSVGGTPEPKEYIKMAQRGGPLVRARLRRAINREWDSLPLRVRRTVDREEAMSVLLNAGATAEIEEVEALMDLE